jgi:two-component system sensor histidine kinase YesM
MPIFFRLSFIIVFVLLVLIAFSLTNYINLSREKESSAVTTVEQTNIQALDKIDSYLQDISNITKIPLTYKLTDETYMKLINQFNLTGEKSLSFQQMNEHMFEEIMAYKPDINSCFVFNSIGQGDYKVKNAIYSLKNPSEEIWFQEAFEQFGKPVIVDTYELPYVADRKSPLYVFGIVRGIVRIESGTVVGVLLVNTEVDYFREITDHMNITDNHRILITSGENTIFDTIQTSIGQKVDEAISKIEWDQSERIKIVEIDGQKMIATSVLSEYSNWRLTSLIPLEELLQDLKDTQRRILIFTISLILLTLGLLFGVSLRIVKPIKRLEAIMRMAENGKFDIQVQVQGKDEIGSLSKSFNAMINRINSLVNEVYIEKINQSQFELQMLQAQINPHFLYNTLESISMMAIINDDEMTSDMAANLGAILRYGISNYNQEVSLSEEIQNLQKYIALQEVRFKLLYTIKITIDPNLYSVRMIKLILQPIVENAVYHGMSNRRSGGEINITASVIGKDGLEFRIADNGGGMSEEQVQKLNEYIQGQNELYSSIGLRNVNKRIKLKYGEEYGVIINSEIGKGTIVFVTIRNDLTAPKKEGDSI